MQSQINQIELKYGTLKINEMQFAPAEDVKTARVTAELNGQDVRIRHQLDGRKLCILFQNSLILAEGDILLIKTSTER